MDVIELLRKRKSVRAYSSIPITPQEKEAILLSALQAPSAGNMELYTIIDITDQNIKDQLSILCDHQPFIQKADMVLIFVTDYTKWMDIFKYYHCNHTSLQESDILLGLEDTAIAAQNAVIAAESLGIGSCYIGDIIENYEQVRKLLDLPQYALPLVMVTFGRPNQGQINRKKPDRFALKDMVYQNTYYHKTIEETKNMFMEQSGKSEEELEDYIVRFYQRKMNAPFSKEMVRSVKVMIEEWVKENV